MRSPRQGKWLRPFVAALVLTGPAAAIAACGSSSSSSGGGDASNLQPKPLPASLCSPVIYEGEGTPNIIIPYVKAFTGGGAGFSNVQFAIFRQYLQQQHWKAGKFRIGVQKCNAATVSAGFTDPAKCADLAQQFATNQDVRTVAAVDSSDCVKTMAPILNRAPGGGVAFTSDAASNVCITLTAKICQTDEPAKYYPSGARNFFRPISNDGNTGTAMAELAKERGFKKVYIISHAFAYGVGIAKVAESALATLGVGVAKSERWDPKATSYRALMQRVKASGADALYAAGYAQDNAAQILKDKTAVLGNGVQLLTTSTFDDPSVTKAAGPAFDGTFVIQENQPASQATGATRALFEQVRKNSDVNPFAYGPYAGASLTLAQFTLNAIGHSDGSRAGIIKAFRAAQVPDGAFGYAGHLAESGDIAPPPPAAYGVMQGGTLKYQGKISYPASLVQQALAR